MNRISRICSLAETIDLLATNQLLDHNILSIWDSNNLKSNDFKIIDKLCSRCKNLKIVVFDDIIRDIYGLITPNIKHIEEIIKWSRNKNNIVVHCHAGVSRSSSSAFIIECMDRTPLEALEIFKDRHVWPNELIIKLGAAVLGKPEIITVIDEWREKELQKDNKEYEN